MYAAIQQMLCFLEVSLVDTFMSLKLSKPSVKLNTMSGNIQFLLISIRMFCKRNDCLKTTSLVT